MPKRTERPTQIALQMPAVRTSMCLRAEPTRRSTAIMAMRKASRPAQTYRDM
jgi:hypothetical protein